ncbi:hypothetical protein FRC09_017388 [Ceratobasidium sp. 395]|nr:hypothetical protein FRC09_017388 [Ceratobasidium sp. 395]
MSQLSLKSLSIDNAHFGDGIGCKFLSSAWLGIQELRCGMQKCQLPDLALFAQNLPHLRELELDVDLDFSGSNIPEETQRFSRKVFCYLSRSPRLYGRTDEQTIDLAKLSNTPEVTSQSPMEVIISSLNPLTWKSNSTLEASGVPPGPPILPDDDDEEDD